jgi:hypothetical protein
MLMLLLFSAGLNFLLLFGTTCGNSNDLTAIVCTCMFV